jgi:hypothetical protein
MPDYIPCQACEAEGLECQYPAFSSCPRCEAVGAVCVVGVGAERRTVSGSASLVARTRQKRPRTINHVRSNSLEGRTVAGNRPVLSVRAQPTYWSIPGHLFFPAIAAYFAYSHVAHPLLNRVVFQLAHSGDPRGLWVYAGSHGPPHALALAVAACGVACLDGPLSSAERLKYGRSFATVARDLLLQGVEKGTVGPLETLETLLLLSQWGLPRGMIQKDTANLLNGLIKAASVFCWSDKDASGKTSVGSEEVPRDWLSWIKEELKIRVWMATVREAVPHLLYGTFIEHHDLYSVPVRLPCSDDFFDHPDPALAFALLFPMGQHARQPASVDFAPLQDTACDSELRSKTVALTLSASFAQRCSMAWSAFYVSFFARWIHLEAARLHPSSPTHLLAASIYSDSIIHDVFSSLPLSLPPSGDLYPLLTSQHFPSGPQQAHLFAQSISHLTWFLCIGPSTPSSRDPLQPALFILRLLVSRQKADPELRWEHHNVTVGHGGAAIALMTAAQARMDSGEPVDGEWLSLLKAGMRYAEMFAGDRHAGLGKSLGIARAFINRAGNMVKAIEGCAVEEKVEGMEMRMLEVKEPDGLSVLVGSSFRQAHGAEAG